MNIHSVRDVLLYPAAMPGLAGTADGTCWRSFAPRGEEKYSRWSGTCLWV